MPNLHFGANLMHIFGWDIDGFDTKRQGKLLGSYNMRRN